MFRHALKLVWNRRRDNVLVVTEIALAFVAAFAVLSVAVHFPARYRQPLGFEFENIWNVQLHTAGSAMQLIDGWSSQDTNTLRNVLQALRGLPQVAAALTAALRLAGQRRTMEAKTVQGQNVQLVVSAAGVTVNSANGVKTDVLAENGVIHVIDTVIMPKA